MSVDLNFNLRNHKKVKLKFRNLETEDLENHKRVNIFEEVNLKKLLWENDKRLDSCLESPAILCQIIGEKLSNQDTVRLIEGIQTSQSASRNSAQGYNTVVMLA